MFSVTGFTAVKVKVKVTLRLTVNKSWCRAPSGAHDQIFITIWQLRSCFFFCGAPLWRDDVSVCCICCWSSPAQSSSGPSPFVLATIFLLSQIWDFPFRHLLRLAGSRWRYSTPPVKVKVKVALRLTVSQSVSQSWCRTPIWGSWPDIYCCLTVSAFLLWGALSDERTGLSFVRVIVCISKSFVIMQKMFTFYMLNMFKIYSIYRASVSPGSAQQVLPHFQ
jgi:hypothetical protein